MEKVEREDCGIFVNSGNLASLHNTDKSINNLFILLSVNGELLLLCGRKNSS